MTDIVYLVEDQWSVNNWWLWIVQNEASKKRMTVYMLFVEHVGIKNLPETVLVESVCNGAQYNHKLVRYVTDIPMDIYV